jgi:dihydrofolate synthase/folylpolyglutamate synthase
MLDLPGLYQTRNLLTVLEACSVLEGLGWKINDTIIRNALQQVRKLTGLHGRWEFIHFHPSVVLDVAHNQDGMAQLVQQAELTDHRELHFVIGFVKDKEIDKILSLLPRHARYYFTEAKIPRALPAAELAAKALAAGLKGDPIPDVNQALRSAMQHAHPDDLVIVCGSVFVVGEVNPVHAKV